MDNADLNLNSEERIDTKSVLLIAGAAAAFTGFILYLLKRTKDEELFETDPPPIIIKSGSFIIESDKILEPDKANERSYKSLEFDGIKGIRVVTYNEQVKDTDDDFFYEGENSGWRIGDNVQVNIDIQICQNTSNGQCTNWGSDRRVEVLNSSKDLEIKVPSELRLSKSKGNKKNKRGYKNEDENHEFIRFRQVRIINKTQGITIKTYPAKDWQEYYLGFYNTLI